MSRHSKAAFRRFQRRMARETDVVLQWVEYDRETEGSGIDRTTGAALFAGGEVKTETVKGFVHFPNHATTDVRVFEEIEDGDCMVDLPPDVVPDGRLNLQFQIDSEWWVQKRLGEKVAKHFDTIVGGERLCRTLVLTKKK